jgi:arylsulfatase A-like enzyme
MSRRVPSRLIAILLLLAAFQSRALAASQPNVILVTLDSVRADRLDFLASQRALTPNIDSLAKQSVIFERAYAQTPNTVASHATILTGVYPQSHKAGLLGSALTPGVPYLPDVLRGRGYRTAAFVGSVLLDPRNGLAPGFDRGFDDYDASFESFGAGKPGGGPSRRSAEQVVARASTWVNSGSSKPFFLWVHLFDAHLPYTDTYDHAITRDDAALGKLLSTLRSRKLFDDAIILVTSDHGESLGSHGENSHGVFLYDETIRVPLLIKLPQNQMAGKQVKGRVRLVDVAPSILEAAAIPVPSQMQGQSLLRIAKNNPDADQPVYSRSDLPHTEFGWSELESWRAGKYLYVHAPKPELYDLTADPGAAHNLAQVSRATLDTMASQLAAFSAHFGGTTNVSSLTSSEMQKLASLGYVGLQKSTTSAPVAGTDPKDVIAIANQVEEAMLNLSLGKPAKAVTALQQAAASQPNAYLPHYGLGVALAQQQQYAKAVDHLHKAIEVQPDSAWAHYAMGMCLAKAGDFRTATVHLELASSRLPEFRDPHLLLAQCYEHLGQAKQAEAEREKAAR